MVWRRNLGLILAWALWASASARAEVSPLELMAGPLVQEFELTLKPGRRVEAAGPFLSYEFHDLTEQSGLHPLWFHTLDRGADAEEFDLAYPLLTYDRFGKEYRFQVLQLLSWAGGETQKEEDKRRFTIFPFYFQQRSPNPEFNYTAVFPFYGRIQNRVFRSESQWILWPIYVKTVRRPAAVTGPVDPDRAAIREIIRERRGDLTTYNYLMPLFHVRRGDALHGWQFWPFYGTESKGITQLTNHWGDVQPVGGHEKRFVLWPFYLSQDRGLGTAEVETARSWFPFYARTRSPQRDWTSYLWPFGFSITDDRLRKYHEIGAPWPVVIFARGEGKTTTRLWPLYSRARTTNLESAFLFWPVYKFNASHSPLHDRERHRIFFFLYSDTTERLKEGGTVARRTDLFPLFTATRDHQGNERLQLLSVLEPFFPASKSIERNYGPVWSIWREERNPRTGASSRSFLWNLYRDDRRPGARKTSLLFGLFQYHSHTDGTRVRLLGVPWGPPPPAGATASEPR